MSASEGFLSMSKKKRECEKEKFESCQARLFQERVKKCGCSPQSLLPALQDQTQVVKTHHWLPNLFHLFQVPVCSKVGLDCHQHFLQNSSPSCPVACEGLYADARRW